jgi:hypothetical protein
VDPDDKLRAHAQACGWPIISLRWLVNQIPQFLASAHQNHNKTWFLGFLNYSIYYNLL